LGSSNLAPLLEILGSDRVHDVGINADTQNYGYRRGVISRGIEFDGDAVKLYADVEVPFYQNVNGNQLTGPVLTKFVVSYNF
jgi:hypothetical protein